MRNILFLAMALMLSGCAWSSDFQAFVGEHDRYKAAQAESALEYQEGVTAALELQQMRSMEVLNSRVEGLISKKEATENIADIASLTVSRVAEAEARRVAADAKNAEVLALKAKIAEEESRARTAKTIKAMVSTAVTATVGPQAAAAVESLVGGIVKGEVDKKMSDSFVQSFDDAYREKTGKDFSETQKGLVGLAAMVAGLLANNRYRNGTRRRGDHLDKT